MWWLRGRAGQLGIKVHCRGVLKIPPVRIDKRQPCFCATCATVKPWGKSAFAEFGNAAIFGKWY
jgi:hypothetical protein